MKKEQKNQDKNEKQKTTVPIKLCTPLVWMANILNVISKFQIKKFIAFHFKWFWGSTYEKSIWKYLCKKYLWIS